MPPETAPGQPARMWCDTFDADLLAVVPGAAEQRARAEEHRQILPGSPWFRAVYPGRCSGCGEGVVPGDKIRADGTGAYCCEDCGAAADLEELF
jgi:hypothetical protein